MTPYNTTYLNNITSIGLLTDRVINDSIELPYSYSDLKIKPNTVITSTSFNDVVERINKNFLYLVSYGKIPGSDLPINYTNFLSGSLDGSYNYYQSTDFTSMSSTPTSILSGVTDISFTPTNDSGSAGVICNNSSVLLLSAQSSDTLTTLSASKLSESGTISPKLKDFDDIHTTAVDVSGNAYIMDGFTIYKYDIAGSTKNDASLKALIPSGRNLTLTMGGSGSISDNVKFASPTSFGILNENLYVLDQTQDYNGAYIKIFDTNFNFKTSNNITSTLKLYPAVDLLPTKDGMLILSLSGHILEYDNDIKLVKVHEPDPVTKSQTFRRLATSKENDNIFYMMTKSHIFKKYKSKPSKTIGRFSPTKMSIDEVSRDFSGISIKISDGGKDELFVSDKSTGVVYRFLEETGYENAFYNTFETEIFPLSSIKVHPDEYVNNFVFNKTFAKILYNHFVLKENARAKFQGFFDNTGDLVFDGIKYPLDEELAAIDYTTSNSNYVGVNEVVLSETINRPIKKIYDLQNLMSGFIKERRTNTSPISTVVVELPKP